jgi:hypothetical protein
MIQYFGPKGFISLSCFLRLFFLSCCLIESDLIKKKNQNGPNPTHASRPCPMWWVWPLGLLIIRFGFLLPHYNSHQHHPQQQQITIFYQNKNTKNILVINT